MKANIPFLQETTALTLVSTIIITTPLQRSADIYRMEAEQTLKIYSS
jgi:hypothetical protein